MIHPLCLAAPVTLTFLPVTKSHRIKCGANDRLLISTSLFSTAHVEEQGLSALCGHRWPRDTLTQDHPAAAAAFKLAEVKFPLTELNAKRDEEEKSELLLSMALSETDVSLL